MSTSKVIIFSLIMTSISAFILAGLFYATAPMAKRGEEVFNKRAILGAVKDYVDGYDNLLDDQVLDIFNEIESVALDMEGNIVEDVMADKIDLAQERKKPEAERVLPFFKYSAGGKDYYILSVRGKGLWDDIWGYVAVESDLRTIAGASFDHKGETPGLGAEIKDNPAFSRQFGGKKIYKDGTYVSVGVIKGGAKDLAYEVDGLSGATVTANGVDEMLYRGIKYYEPYFGKAKG